MAALGASLEDNGAGGDLLVSVSNPQEHHQGLQKFVDYEITTRTSLPQFRGGNSTVRRRFKDFEWLDDSLRCEVYPGRGAIDLPPLPEKHMFGNLDSDYADNSFVELRRQGLENYLCTVVSYPEYLHSPSLITFLQADEGKFATAQIDSNSIQRYLNAPVKFSMEGEIEKATYTLLNFTEDNTLEGEDTVPIDLLCGCAGIAFITMAKGGFFFSGRVGTGLVIARLPNGGWSAPSAIGAGGIGWGFQVGGEVTDMMIILNEPDAVEAFCSNAQLSMGTELSLSFGPIGRSAETNLHAGDGGMCTVFSYAHSKGLFVGVSLQAAVVVARPDVNRAFYGQPVSREDLLSGAYPPPEKAEPLYRALHNIHEKYHIIGAPNLRAWNQRRSEAPQRNEDNEFSAPSRPVAAPYAPVPAQSPRLNRPEPVHPGDEWSTERARRLSKSAEETEILTGTPYEMNCISTEVAARFMREDVDQDEEDHNEIRV